MKPLFRLVTTSTIALAFLTSSATAQGLVGGHLDPRTGELAAPPAQDAKAKPQSQPPSPTAVAPVVQGPSVNQSLAKTLIDEGVKTISSAPKDAGPKRTTQLEEAVTIFDAALVFAERIQDDKAKNDLERATLNNLGMLHMRFVFEETGSHLEEAQAKITAAQASLKQAANAKDKKEAEARLTVAKAEIASIKAHAVKSDQYFKLAIEITEKRFGKEAKELLPTLGVYKFFLLVDGRPLESMAIQLRVANIEKKKAADEGKK